MEKLKLPKKERPPGLYIYCNGCETYYRDETRVSCLCNGKVYKAKIHIPGQHNRCRTRSFTCTNFDDAMVSYRAFKRELEANSFHIIATNTVVNESASLMFTDCIEQFMQYLKNENVPFHAIIDRTDKGISAYERSLKYLGYSLIENGIDPVQLQFDKITDHMVGYFCEYLFNKIDSNRTFNNHISEVKKFSRFVFKKHNLAFENPFEKVEYLPTITDKKIVDLNEFESLLELVSPEIECFAIEKSGKRSNCFRPWMRDAFQLGLYTGARREELVQLKWSGIKLNKTGELAYIETEHLKINRAKNKRVIKKVIEIKRIPVNYDLHKMLYELGYEKYKGTEHFILAPHETASRNYMMKMISLSFTEYFKKIKIGKLKQFKHLRKTYITALYLKKGEKAMYDTAHTTMSVLHKHYINEAAVAERIHEETMILGSIFS